MEARNTIINEHLLSDIDRCIFEEDNRKLIATYTSEEIREALFEMGSTKALGKTDFQPYFIKDSGISLGMMSFLFVYIF
ncbi:reverse transcriptase [Gossypium australe]|uniref:Reverse transcriptase n=1 Tax=Gossypium australe TaxID=47621 RepID=A0A5B6U3C7_9ROSI|nr:reverse transcriptase [Gossypium australe]